MLQKHKIKVCCNIGAVVSNTRGENTDCVIGECELWNGNTSITQVQSKMGWMLLSFKWCRNYEHIALLFFIRSCEFFYCLVNLGFSVSSNLNFDFYSLKFLILIRSSLLKWSHGFFVFHSAALGIFVFWTDSHFSILADIWIYIE